VFLHKQKDLNILAASLRIYCTWKLGKNQGYFSDFSLVSNKNLSEILPSIGLGLGSDEVGQKDLKQLHL